MHTAVLFDFDGVIADTFTMNYEVSRSFDASLTEDEYRARFLGNINNYRSWGDEEEKKRHDDAFFSRYLPRLLEAEIYPEMAAVVKGLAKDHLLFVVSSTLSAPIEGFLKREGLDRCFSGIYGNDVHRSKVEKIKMILSGHSLDPSRCVFVTDTVGDIREARKCGVDSIAVPWGFHDAPLLGGERPFGIASSADDLKSLIAQKLDAAA